MVLVVLILSMAIRNITRVVVDQLGSDKVRWSPDLYL